MFKISSLEEYQTEYDKSISDPVGFWSGIATTFSWKKPFSKTLEWNFSDPSIRWFHDGVLNITDNILDRHLKEKANKTAILWEPNDPNDPSIRISYQELHDRVCQLSNALVSLGITKGDRVCLYMPMIPELAVSVLACARIGAIHSVVFAGFSANALKDRVEDAQAKLILTSDVLKRGTKEMNLKSVVDEAAKDVSCVKHVVVFSCKDKTGNMKSGRDLWWDEIVSNQSCYFESVAMNSEDPLFILYTSGSTGKPKGVVHSIAGYMVYTAYSFQNVYQYEENDVFWCTADIGWITGHSYIVYGPLLAGATTVMFEGIPTFPDASRFWQTIEKHNVTQFLTAPTAIRSLMACDLSFVDNYKMPTLKILGSVGEPINQEAWEWYANHVGKNRCAIVDNWWQTETGGIMISGLGDFSPQKPTYAGLPLPGIQPVLLNQEGKEIEAANEEGYLCIKFPWPSMLRTTYGDHERCRLTYFSHYEGVYFTGDGAKRDENGMYRIIGRVDDVINVSGHRFGTAEIENAINHNGSVIESAVVGYPHPVKGQSIYAFVVLDLEAINDDVCKNKIISTVSEQIGRIAIPDKIQVVSGLPKTRSGKIMRRILRKIAEDDISSLGDTSTLLDPLVVDEIVANKL